MTDEELGMIFIPEADMPIRHVAVMGQRSGKTMAAELARMHDDASSSPILISADTSAPILVDVKNADTSAMSILKDWSSSTETRYDFTRRPYFAEPYVDPKTPVFNAHKHRQTCDKNRKKRKKKKR